MSTLSYGYFKAAVKSVSSNKLRSALTMLGIVVGVVSVVSIVSIGEGVKHQIQDQIDHFGKDLITVRPGNERDVAGASALTTINSILDANEHGSLSDEDIVAVQRTKNVKYEAPLSVVGGRITGGDHNPGNVTVVGTTEDFADMLGQKITYGSNLDDSMNNATTAILGSRVAERMFDDPVPLGRSFTIRGEQFFVAGIFDDFDTAPFSSEINFNNAIYIPYDTAQQITGGSTATYEILVRPVSAKETDQVIKDLKKNIASAHGGQKDFSVLTHAQSAEVSNGILNLMTTLIGGVAAISLLVGGIGIMNIMLVSVAERMHEIGIRKAVGATNRQILDQFVTEAAVLSLAGGVLGVIVAFLIDIALRLSTSLQPIITWQIVVAALVVSLLVGIIFGSAPALKAARKDPINALRNE
ncbi:MAG TPA: ABC transporter permease [Candidatus Saccharimonadales bacterium]|nr:ABC transporter permease [Candidatus Saccharimonadales bacterium]